MTGSEVGVKVYALGYLYDTNVDGRMTYAARPGDIGVIEHIDAEDGAPTIRWERSGRALTCDDSEFELVGVPHGRE